MMNFLPILIILVIVFGIVSLVARIMKKTVNRKGKYSYSKRVRGVFFGYLAILLICLVVNSLLPVKGRTDWKVVRIEDLEKESTDLHDAAIKGRIDQVDDKFRIKKWNFVYHDAKLTTTVKNNKFLNTQVVIERKETNDDKIEAVYYKTRSSMNNMDITSKYNPIDLKLVGDHLNLMPPPKSKMKFTEFANVFSVNQFTGEKSFSHSTDFFEGQSVLYLRIPKNLQLADESNLPFVFTE
jgi:hypothetical protein